MAYFENEDDEDQGTLELEDEDSARAEAEMELRAQAVVNAVEDSEDEDDLNDQLDDVDERLEVAGLYRQFLRNSMFEQRTAAVERVERRIRAFVRGELQVLLGLPAEKGAAKNVPSPFSEDEVKALKAIAARVVTGARSDAPQLRQVQANQPQQVAPVPAKPQGPALRPVRSAEPPAPKRAAAPAAAPKRKAQRADPSKPQIIEIRKSEDGTAQMVTSRTPTGRIIKEMLDMAGKPIRRPDGRAIRQDVTPPVPGLGYIPMPSQEQQTFLSEQMAHATLNAGIGNEANHKPVMSKDGPIRAQGHGPLGAVLAQIAVNSQ